MSKTIKQLAERFYEIINTEGDLSEVLSEDFLFGIMPGFPYGGEHHGLSASLEFFEQLSQHFDYWEVEPIHFIEIDPNNLIVTGLYRTRATKTGNSAVVETAHFWTQKDGKLNTYKHYCDTAIVSDVLNHRVPRRIPSINQERLKIRIVNRDQSMD